MEATTTRVKPLLVGGGGGGVGGTEASLLSPGTEAEEWWSQGVLGVGTEASLLSPALPPLTLPLMPRSEETYCQACGAGGATVPSPRSDVTTPSTAAGSNNAWTGRLDTDWCAQQRRRANRKRENRKA